MVVKRRNSKSFKPGSASASELRVMSYTTTSTTTQRKRNYTPSLEELASPSWHYVEITKYHNDAIVLHDKIPLPAHQALPVQVNAKRGGAAHKNKRVRADKAGQTIKARKRANTKQYVELVTQLKNEGKTDTQVACLLNLAQQSKQWNKKKIWLLRQRFGIGCSRASLRSSLKTALRKGKPTMEFQIQKDASRPQGVTRLANQ